MSAKITASRRAAFLKALAATGNVTLSAERAKVSRSWVLLHRKRDPDFDAACRAALAAAKAAADALRASGGMKPASGWGHLDGVALVVRGSGGSGPRLVQIARARLRQWDPPTEDRFLATLSATANVKAACAEAGMSHASAYVHRKRWTEFARRWDAALDDAIMRIELALLERGCNPFSAIEAPIEGPVRVMTAPEALYLIKMHKRRQEGHPRRAGGPPRRPSAEEVRKGIVRKLEAIVRAERLSEEDKARDREQWALRRSSGQARGRSAGKARGRG